MAGVVSQLGLREALQLWTGKIAGTGLPAGTTPYTIRLFANNITPTVFTLTAAFTEPTFGGYFPRDVPAPILPVWNGVNGYNQSFNSIAWTWDGIGPEPTFYGYFVLRDDGVTMWSDKVWPSGLTLTIAQPKVLFLPTLDSLDEFT